MYVIARFGEIYELAVLLLQKGNQIEKCLIKKCKTTVHVTCEWIALLLLTWEIIGLDLEMDIVYCNKIFVVSLSLLSDKHR